MFKPSSDEYELIWDECGFPIGEAPKRKSQGENAGVASAAICEIRDPGQPDVMREGSL